MSPGAVAPPGRNDARGLYADAARTLRSATAGPVRDGFERQLSTGQQVLWRDGPPEHFTASAVVFSAGLDEVLLVLHRKAGLWLQPGGHFEPGDDSVVAAALREATEESGMAGLRVVPGALHLDRHELPSTFGHCRAHWDLRLAAVAPPDAAPVVSPESSDARWWPWDRLPEPTDPDLAACVADLRTSVIDADTPTHRG